MNDDFNQRWGAAAKAVRQVPLPETVEALPFGFTTRLLARFEAAPMEPWVDLITALGLRAVVTSAVLFAAGAAVVFWQMEAVPLVPDLIEVPFAPTVFWP